MRISDWSSDVCSSDLHYDTMTKRLAQGLAGDVAAVIALMERNPELQARREIFQMARSAMQLQLTFTEGMALPHLAPPRVRSILETRLDDALRERVGQPFTMDARSIPGHVEILVKLPEGVLRARVTDERLFSSTTYIFIFWTIGSSVQIGRAHV